MFLFGDSKAASDAQFSPKHPKILDLRLELTREKFRKILRPRISQQGS
jgi:hypothetical protein